VVFADLFAADGILQYPFAGPGQPGEVRGREEIRAHFAGRPHSRELFEMDLLQVQRHDTTDPEVVIAEIEHRGRSALTGKPYRLPAVGVIRVRDGLIMSYRDYLDPIATAQVLGRTEELIQALTSP
jgi:ketosteroid isomerase-like protein